ncbi:MAG: Hsp20/alpha crystallin family protein [Actinobacteria bacterium]|nr:Hsp20/alpha crystallin family protein [Actinomycetota bacterium]MBW3642805.1 Hsp20/alpha crystallin family protein [Actinomycetota bacterium]
MALPVRRSNDERNEPARWDPFGELDQLSRRLASFLDARRQLPDLLADGFTPLADVEETTDAYTVEIELPGVKRDDVDIEVAGRRVAVRGERKEKERVGILRRRDRTIGRFSYEVTLPGDVQEDGVEAHLDEGVLTLRLPKPERERPRRIEIH